MAHNSRRKSDRRGRLAHVLGERERAAKKAEKLEARQERRDRRAAKKIAEQQMKHSDMGLGDLFAPSDDWAPSPFSSQ